MADNKTKISTTYHQRLYYKYTFFQDVTSKIDFWSDRRYYGLLDNRGVPVYLDKKYLKYISTPSITNPVGRQTMINFVSDSFNEMIHYFKRADLSFSIPKSAYNPLNIKKSTLLFETEYKNYITNFLNTFYNFNKIEIDTKVETFDDFLKLFINFMVDTNSIITQSAFLTSYFSSPLLTGMVVEFSDTMHDNDPIKIQKFINDVNFEFFCNTAERFSFMVDKNAPWRLVYNPTTDYAKEKMNAYEISSINDLFSKYYVYPHLTEYEIIKSELIKFYVNLITKMPTIQKSRFCMIKRKMLFDTITRSLMTEKGDLFWIHFYYYVRCKEEKIEMHQSQFDTNLSSITIIYNNAGKNSVLDWILSKTKKFIDGGTNPSYIQYRLVTKNKLDNTTPYSFKF